MNSRFVFKSLFILVLLWITSNLIHPESRDVILTDDFTSEKINSRIILLNETSPLSLPEVVTAYRKGLFEEADKFVPEKGERKRYLYWLCFTLDNRSRDSLNWYIIDKVGKYKWTIDIFRLENNNLVKAGNVVNPIMHSFYLKVAPGTKQTYFVRIRRVKFLLDAVCLSEKAYQFTLMETTAFYGIFFGILFITAFYNLVLLLSFRRRAYFFYFTFIFCFAFNFLLYYGLLTDLIPHFGKIELITMLVRVIFEISFVLFAADFLHAEKFTPKLNILVKLVCFIHSCFALTSFFLGLNYYFVFENLLSYTRMAGIFFLFIITYFSLKQKHRPALFFLGAASFLLISILLFSLVIISPSILPYTHEDIIRLRVLEVTQLCMIILFTLGLADSINTIRDQKERALEKSIEQAGLNAALELDKKMLHKELELAKQIQTALLPVDTIHRDFEICASMVPAEEVGGDYYNFTYDTGNHLWISIGDVSGHGMSSGLIMMIALTIHTTITSTMDISPSEAVKTVNTILLQSIRKKMGKEHMMSFTSFKYEGEGLFTFAGLHLPLIVYREKEKKCELIETGGIYLNMISDISHVTVDRELLLSPGDLLVLYTDGLIEARNNRKILFDIPGLTGLIEKYARLDTESIKTRILTEILKWSDNNQDDDMTLILIRRRALE